MSLLKKEAQEDKYFHERRNLDSTVITNSKRLEIVFNNQNAYNVSTILQEKIMLGTRGTKYHFEKKSVFNILYNNLLLPHSCLT